jgi:uncharacterized protein YfbU (UPF0304 family)
MARVQLTDAERLLLANQYEILGILHKQESYLRAAANLRDGHKWLYEQHVTEISDNLPDEEVEYV